MENIGIICAGQMGRGIAQVCARAGIKVAMADVGDDVLGRGLAGIEAALARLVSRERITQPDVDAALANISTGTDYGIFSDCDLVIEAAVEDEDIKRRILAKLVPVLAPAALIATNTSSISITRLAAATDPQTSGGLLFCLAEKHLSEALAALRQAGVPACVAGAITVKNHKAFSTLTLVPTAP